MSQLKDFRGGEICLFFLVNLKHGLVNRQLRLTEHGATRPWSLEYWQFVIRNAFVESC